VAGTKYASSSNGSPTFLNLGVDYPSSRRFTVVIWGRNRSRFGAPERRYRGRTICVRGHVDTYRGIPEIEARSPSQIRIVG
jgi:DNA/RNA endonuclease YhcR with UshA esterase domain